MAPKTSTSTKEDKPEPSNPKPVKPKGKPSGLHPKDGHEENGDSTVPEGFEPIKLESPETLSPEKKASLQRLAARLAKRLPAYEAQDKDLPDNQELPEVTIPGLNPSRLVTLDPKKIYLRPKGAKKNESADDGAVSAEDKDDDEDEGEMLPIEKRTPSYIDPKTGKLIVFRKDQFVTSDNELDDTIEEVRVKVSNDLRRGGVRVTDERELALIMYAAEYMTRDVLKDHIINGISVLATCAGVAIAGVHFAAAKALVSIPIGIDKATAQNSLLSKGVDLVGKAVGLAEVSKKLLGNWDMVKVGRGMEAFEDVYKNSKHSREQYDNFVRVAVAKKLIMKRKNEEEDRKSIGRA